MHSHGHITRISYGYVLFNYSMEMTNKGIERVYEKIQIILIVIDLSNNRFEGEISEGHWKSKRAPFAQLIQQYSHWLYPIILGELIGA
jgi:hypothetical protein